MVIFKETVLQVIRCKKNQMSKVWFRPLMVYPYDQSFASLFTCKRCIEQRITFIFRSTSMRITGTSIESEFLSAFPKKPDKWPGKRLNNIFLFFCCFLFFLVPKQRPGPGFEDHLLSLVFPAPKTSAPPATLSSVRLVQALLRRVWRSLRRRGLDFELAYRCADEGNRFLYKCVKNWFFSTIFFNKTA